MCNNDFMTGDEINENSTSSDPSSQRNEGTIDVPPESI
jgi:hypothetical protein